MSEEKKKVSKFTVSVMDNGFTTELYGYNLYGSDIQSKNIRTTSTEVFSEFMSGVVGHNAEIDAAKAEKERKEKKEAGEL